jgi:hypothetical protein
MKYIISVLILWFNFASAQSVGVIAGEPTGISAKYKSFDAGMGWSFVDESFLDVHVDRLSYFKNVFQTKQYPFDFFWGYGVRMKFADQFRIGARFPIGLSYSLQRWEFFGEIAPILDFYPASQIKINGGIGVRYTL